METFSSPVISPSASSLASSARMDSGVRFREGSSSAVSARRGTAGPRLADLARVRKQTMAQAVEQLERLGYVERRPNPKDRRARLVFLTERGGAVRPVTHTAAAAVEKRWAELTSPDDQEALRAALQRLLTELRRQ